jgi:hypothetical protein
MSGPATPLLAPSVPVDTSRAVAAAISRGASATARTRVLTLLLEKVSVRVDASAAWAAFEEVHGDVDGLYVHALARLVAFEVGAVFDHLEAELHPRTGEIGHRADLYFKASPAQRCEIARALSARGIDVVQGGESLAADPDGDGVRDLQVSHDSGAL